MPARPGPVTRVLLRLAIRRRPPSSLDSVAGYGSAAASGYSGFRRRLTSAVLAVVEVGGEDRPIVGLSRETNSGTHVYFLEEVLRLGQEENKTLFSPDTLLLPSSEGITAEVRDNPNAIGYDGLGYVTPEVKVLAVGKATDSSYVLPSAETVNNGTYPIARDLYMYTAGPPEGAVEDYLQWILSAQAQEIVSELGFVPINNP